MPVACMRETGSAGGAHQRGGVRQRRVGLQHGAGHGAVHVRRGLAWRAKAGGGHNEARERTLQRKWRRNGERCRKAQPARGAGGRAAARRMMRSCVARRCVRRGSGATRGSAAEASRATPWRRKQRFRVRARAARWRVRAFTDSTTPKVLPAFSTAPFAGSSTYTTSPSSDCTRASTGVSARATLACQACERKRALWRARKQGPSGAKRPPMRRLQSPGGAAGTARGAPRRRDACGARTCAWSEMPMVPTSPSTFTHCGRRRGELARQRTLAARARACAARRVPRGSSRTSGLPQLRRKTEHRNRPRTECSERASAAHVSDAVRPAA
jgi:hypothetical protein